MLVKSCEKMNLLILTICATTIVTIKAQGSLLSLEPAISLDSKDIESSVHRTRSLPQVEESTHGNWTTLYEALDVYNVRKLAENWSKGKYPVTEECSKDIAVFIDGLKREELWARKMEDASGRYTNSFFWGNSFFVGSATECNFIGMNYNKGSQSLRASANEVREFNAEPKKKKKNHGLSGDILLTPTISDTPPFKIGFYMMKIKINGTVSPTSRQIHIGVCLPFSCTAADVAIVGKLAASKVAGKHSTIEKVRDQHNPYNPYEDSVFWILFGSTVFVSILMTAGTSYDVYLTKKVKRATVNYDLEKHAKLEQLSNGKTPTVSEHVVNGGNSVNNNNNDHEVRASPDPMPEQLSVCEELLLSFSIRANWRTICDKSVGRDTISTIHGLRAISMAWVILGHTCIVVFKYSDNMEYRKIVEKRFLFQTVTSGAFSVDTFFFMGGLLVSYIYCRTNAKGDLSKLTQGTRGFVAGLLKFFGLIAYRFCRLTTPYMFVLGIVEVSMKWFNANSVFEPPTADHVNCPNYWWRNLLYINTLFPVEEMCMLWSWYVADDTQFYIVGAIILILATSHLKIAAFSVVTLLLSSWATTAYIAYTNNHMPSSDDPLALFDKIYDKPWTRLGPYLVGMSIGYFLFRTNCKLTMSKMTVTVGWLLSTACLLSLLYGLYEAELSAATAAAYSSLSHTAWSLGLAWIVVACSTGYGGLVNTILSAPILYPFSRVTYCAYLVHPIVIRLTAMNLDAPFHLGKDTVMITFIGQVALSYTLSFAISLAFEAPVVSMLKIVAPNKRRRIQ